MSVLSSSAAGPMRCLDGCLPAAIAVSESVCLPAYLPTAYLPTCLTLSAWATLMRIMYSTAIYILDHEGVIRFQGMRHEDSLKAVAQLMAEVPPLEEEE